MKTWHKILVGVFGAAVAVLPLFVKNTDSRKKLDAIEDAAGTAIGEVMDARS